MKKMLLAATAMTMLAPFAQAQTYPSKPVTIIVPSVAGGPVDLLARAVAPEVSRVLGQQLLIDNKPGASGKIGIQALLAAPRDGYTIAGLTYTYLVTLPATDADAGYDPDKDLLPITNGIQAPTALVVHKDVPVKTLAEFVTYAKQQGEKLNYGTFGTASSVHFGSEALWQKLGVKLTHVPYKGEANSLQDFVAGRLQVMLTSGAAKPHVETGALRVLATSGEARWEQFPDVPTFRAQGVDYVWGPWLGFGAAAGIPVEAQNKLHAALTAALKTDGVKAAFRKYGYDTVPTTPDQFRATIAQDRAMVSDVMKAGRIKLTE